MLVDPDNCQRELDPAANLPRVWPALTGGVNLIEPVGRPTDDHPAVFPLTPRAPPTAFVCFASPFQIAVHGEDVTVIVADVVSHRNVVGVQFEVRESNGTSTAERPSHVAGEVPSVFLKK